jgi:hypothetical protein
VAHAPSYRLRDPRGAAAMPRALHLSHHGVEINAAVLLPASSTAMSAASGVQCSVRSTSASAFMFLSWLLSESVTGDCSTRVWRPSHIQLSSSAAAFEQQLVLLSSLVPERKPHRTHDHTVPLTRCDRG